MGILDKVSRKLHLEGSLQSAWSGVEARAGSGVSFEVRSPIDRSSLAQIKAATDTEYEAVLTKAMAAFEIWRLVPAPVRGQVVREIADAIRENKALLGELVSIETGKILSEGEGEVQEAIDIADFSVGLSRQLYGKSMHSERPGHRMYEQWHPLGVVGVITAFNFPAAVWAWNAMLAAVCGDVVVWKPSELAPLTAIALHRICSEVVEKHGYPPIFHLLIGEGPALGQRIAEDSRVSLVSATGSCRMGRSVGEAVARRLGKVLLELGGNNAVIVLDDANLEMAVRSTVFGSVGTAGQRCTTSRRLFVGRGIEQAFLAKLSKAYEGVRIGNPLDPATLMGPLINERAVEAYRSAIERAVKEGGKVLCGGKVLSGLPSGLYVQPTIIYSKEPLPVSRDETFAPILYVTPVADIDEAIQKNNSVAQGLSSAVFTESLKSAERFLSHAGSDCGIANVNLGTSGAEIGGAFGGEKDTGGGRESGSDAWKQYMRRQTNTINFSEALPLAQGVTFDVS